MEKLIANFIAMEYSTAEDLKRSLAVECPEVDVKDITGNNLIFTFAPMPQNGADDTANIGSAIRTTYLSEVGRFEEDDCLPIPQGVVIAVAREFSHWDADHIKEKLCELGIEYKMIGIGDIKENADGALIIYALPGIKRYSLSGMPDQNKRWLEFLREA
ncbi:MAG: hypothetical protein NTY34_08255, partial [Candidatus Omnitrophica bacterium]|nr:hypothetical protein [Candidatus Omnitrophota bacterium]